MKNKIRKTFSFNKIAYFGEKRVNLPEVEVELEYTEKGPVLSICGSIWNSKQTDYVCCGQCLDTMMKFSSLANNTLFKKLHNLWKNWHLNDVCAGTVKQEDALKDAIKAGHKFCSYEDECKYLDSIGLLEDNGYKYGSSWLYHEIPEDTLKEIETLLSA